MKFTLIAILSLISTQIFAKSADVCLAEKVNYGGYSLNTKYKVRCNNTQDFEILGKFSPKKRLVQNMNKRGYNSFVEFQLEDKHPRSDRRVYRYFSKSSDRQSKTVCGLSYGNRRYIQYSKVFVYDFLIACNFNTDNAQFISGDTVENVKKLMEDKGYIKVLSFTAKDNYLYSNSLGKVIPDTKTIIYELK